MEVWGEGRGSRTPGPPWLCSWTQVIKSVHRSNLPIGPLHVYRKTIYNCTNECNQLMSKLSNIYQGLKSMTAMQHLPIWKPLAVAVIPPKLYVIYSLKWPPLFFGCCRSFKIKVEYFSIYIHFAWKSWKMIKIYWGDSQIKNTNKSFVLCGLSYCKL